MKVTLKLFCLLLIATMSYSFAQSNEARLPIALPEEPPVEGKKDCLAAGTQVTLSDGVMVNIENISESQLLMAAYTMQDTLVASLEAARLPMQSSVISSVSANSSNGKIMYELTDSLGNSLTGTSNHPIITVNRGVVSMDELRMDDILITTMGNSSVVGLEVVDYEGLVHNFLLGESSEEPESLATMDIMSQSFFANNILVGDLALQHALSK